MWREGVAGVVATTLVVVPALAVTCAAACLRPNTATDPSASGSAHAHHGTGSAQQGEKQVGAEVGVPTLHDCRHHDRVSQRAATVTQSVRAERQVKSAAEPPLQFPLAVSISIARHIHSTHGPPGTAGTVKLVVLRI